VKKNLKQNDQPDWDDSLKMIPDDGLALRQLERVNILLDASRFDTALPELEALANLEIDSSGKPIWNQVNWYDIACNYGRISPHIAGRQKELEDRAMELLIKAVDKGFRDADFMARDATLEPIRKRPEFAGLLERIRSAEGKRN
jgi:hypothetical protein